jgi:hypothetical protein
MVRMKHLVGLAIFLVIFYNALPLLAFDYVINDFKFYPVPNIPRPPKGVQFTDPIFHTSIVRITDAPTEAIGGKYNYAQAGYSKHDIENADGTKLIIQTLSSSTWFIWNANPPYNKILEISPTLIGWGRAIDCRWDAVDPNILYFTMGGKLYKYDIRTPQHATVLHDFKDDFPSADYAGVGMDEEGTPSEDSRYWAYRVTYFNLKHSPQWWPHAILVYDKDFYGKDKGKVISMIDETNPNFRGPGFTSMSPDGKYVWIGDADHIYPRDLSSVKAMNIEWGHADWAISKEGRLVLFGFALKDNNWNLGYWATMIDVETNEITYLAGPIGLPRYHFSGKSYNKPGWGIISTYQYNEKMGGGPMYNDFEISMIELTKRKAPPPRVWRLAKTHTNMKDGYADAPFAKINKKGTKVWFGSGWGASYTDPGGQYDVYQINLPSTWYQDLMGK